VNVHHFCFATIGRRDQEGQFIHRKRFYDLSSAFHADYERRLSSYLKQLARDIFS